MRNNARAFYIEEEMAKTCDSYFMETDLSLMVFFTKEKDLAFKI